MSWMWCDRVPTLHALTQAASVSTSEVRMKLKYYLDCWLNCLCDISLSDKLGVCTCLPSLLKYPSFISVIPKMALAVGRGPRGRDSHFIPPLPAPANARPAFASCRFHPDAEWCVYMRARVCVCEVHMRISGPTYFLSVYLSDLDTHRHIHSDGKVLVPLHSDLWPVGNSPTEIPLGCSNIALKGEWIKMERKEQEEVKQACLSHKLWHPIKCLVNTTCLSRSVFNERNLRSISRT